MSTSSPDLSWMLRTMRPSSPLSREEDTEACLKYVQQSRRDWKLQGHFTGNFQTDNLHCTPPVTWDSEQSQSRQHRTTSSGDSAVSQTLTTSFATGEVKQSLRDCWTRGPTYDNLGEGIGRFLILRCHSIFCSISKDSFKRSVSCIFYQITSGPINRHFEFLWICADLFVFVDDSLVYTAPRR